MLDTPFSPWPAFTDEEIDAVSSVLRSNRVNYWTGEEGREFEKEFADFSNSTHAIALANGTVALELALIALGIGPGDEVIVTPRTFVASVSSIVNAHATPIFADVDAHSQNITANTIRKVITDKTKAIICVHLAGWPCEMDEIMQLAAEFNLKVIEDCAQAHGAKYKGVSVGSIGHIGTWSFCQDKIMTTGGEGGMVTTNDSELWSTMWSYKDHGKSWDAVNKKQETPGYRWLHDSFGSNFRLTEMQSAIGRIQLGKMELWHQLRTQHAERILGTCERYAGALHTPKPTIEIEHAWYKCYVFVKPQGLKAGWNRDRIMITIEAKGVPCFSGSCSEVYLEKAFDGTGWRPEPRLPMANQLGETSLMFLVHPSLTENEIEATCAAIDSVMEEAAS